jgi:hypothetical protein
MSKTLAKSGSRMSTAAENLTIGKSASKSSNGPLDADLLRKMDAWWRAANYLSSARLIFTTIRSSSSR